MKKKLISMVLSVFMVVSLFCGTYFAAKNILGFEPATSQVAIQDKDENVSAKATPSGNWLDKDGSGNWLYIGSGIGSAGTSCVEVNIYNVEQLARFCRNVNDNYYLQGTNFYYKNANVYLCADLDMSAHYWTPIGTQGNPFGGNFYGQGHTIDGVYIKTQVADDGVERAFGLFGFVDGYIKDVAVRGDYEFLPEEKDWPVDDVAIGGIAGCLRANSGGHSTHSIEDCSFDGSITISAYSENGSYVGGIVGVVYQSKFKESPNGGDGHSTSILCCTNYARIQFSDASRFSIGGIVARINCSTTYVQACTNLGLFCRKGYPEKPIITIDEKLWEIRCFGGIVGAAYGTNVYGCVNYSTIHVSNTDNAYDGNGGGQSYAHNLGGIVGVGYDYVYIEKCINYGDIGISSDAWAIECVGGIAGQLGANKKENVYDWQDKNNAKTHVHCHNCISYGHVYGKITKKPSHWVSALVGWINAGTNLNAMDGCRYLVNAVNNDLNTTNDHWCEYSDDMKNGKKVVGPRKDYCSTFTPEYYSSSGSLYFTMGQNGGNWDYCSFDSYELLIAIDYLATANINTMSGYEMTWTTAAKNYLSEFFGSTLNKETIANIKDCSETIVPSAALRRFKLELKWEDSSGTRRDFSSDSLAKITLKNKSESTSCTYAYVYHLKGAVYNNVGKWSSDALFSITYDSNQFTFSTFEESVATKRINWKSTYGVKFDFKVGSVGMAISDYKAFSYFGADNYNNPPTITAVFTAKTQNVTFETYLGSTKTAGLGVIRTGATYGSGDTIVGSNSSSGTGAYSYLATISVNITPTLGYYLYAVKDEKDNAKNLDREYVTSYGGRTRLTIENYDPSLFTTLKFVFKRIEYAYRLLCSWDSNSELSRVDKRWCIGNALTGADNTAYSKDSIPAQLQYGWTYYISAVVFGNGDDGPTDTHNLTYNANNQGCIYTSGTSRRIGFDGVLSSFNVDENAFCSACGNIDFVLGRTKIDYEVSTERYITGSTIIEDDRAGKVTLGGGNTSATKKVKVLDSMQVEMQTYVGYNLDKVEIRNISNSVQNSYDVADTDIPKQLEPNSKNEINAGLEYYLAGMAIKGKLTNEANFGKNIKIRVYFSRKKVQFYINNLTISGDNVTRNVELECYEAPYFNVINVTARDPKANERYCGIYSGSNLLTTESTYTFLVDANVPETEIGELSIEAKFVEFETTSVVGENTSSVEKDGDYYLIDSAKKLIWASDQVNNRGMTSLKLKITADIDMQGRPFEAIGSARNQFDGELQGQGHTISNIYPFYNNAIVQRILGRSSVYSQNLTVIVGTNNAVGGYYEIDSAQKLIWASDFVNNKGHRTIKLKITADIDMQGSPFEAIGSARNQFDGELQGQGHTISNIYPFYNNAIVQRILGKSSVYSKNLTVIVGTNNIFNVASAEDLVWLSDAVNAGFDFSGYIVKQTQDIDMSGKILNPIGSEAHPFCGVYDGQNHIIANLDYTGWDSISYVGFFGKTKNAAIRNLTIKDSKFFGYNYVGAFAAVADTTTFENVNAYNCTLNALHLQFYDIYGNPISVCESDATISVNYIRPTTIETQGKTATGTLASKSRRVGLFGGFVGYCLKCKFTLASYIYGSHTNELGTINAFVGTGGQNTFNRCCALTQFSRSSKTTSLSISSVRYAYDGGTFTDVFAAHKGSSISVLAKQIDNSSNWITINDLEVLKDFYWYYN